MLSVVTKKGPKLWFCTKNIVSKFLKQYNSVMVSFHKKEETSCKKGKKYLHWFSIFRPYRLYKIYQNNHFNVVSYLISWIYQPKVYTSLTILHREVIPLDHYNYKESVLLGSWNELNLNYKTINVIGYDQNSNTFECFKGIKWERKVCLLSF